jgi:ABC-type uncharacterized transport system auxiliary subunit
MKRLTVIAAISVLLYSCASGKPIKYYRIEIPAPASAPAAGNSPIALQISNIDAPPIMRDGRILYQVGAHEVGAYEYHRWVETPDRIVQDSLLRILRASGRYQSVDTLRSSVRPDYIVQGKIYEFGEVDKPEVSTRVSMEIELHEARSSRTVWSRRYTGEDAVDGKAVPDVVESLDRNLRRGLTEIVAGIDQYFATASAGKSK